MESIKLIILSIVNNGIITPRTESSRNDIWPIKLKTEKGNLSKTIFHFLENQIR